MRKQETRNINQLIVLKMETRNLNSMESINKWIYWCFNYSNPNRWIYEIWSGFMADHFMAKFNHLYEVYGSDSVMNRFYSELDSENRILLMNYVIENYKGEPQI